MDKIDEWSKLESAVAHLAAHRIWDSPCCEGDGEAADDIVELVPRLLRAYEELWEISGQMMAAWEELKAREAEDAKKCEFGGAENSTPYSAGPNRRSKLEVASAADLRKLHPLSIHRKK